MKKRHAKLRRRLRSKMRLRFNRGRPEGDWRGSNVDRANRKKWLLKTFGNGKTVPCTHCNKKLTYETLTSDRIIPGCQGGRYNHANIQPSCKRCNDKRNVFECVGDPNYETEDEKAEAMFRPNPRRQHKAASRIKSKFKIYRRRSVA